MLMISLRTIYLIIFTTMFCFTLHAQTAEEAKILHEKGRELLNEGNITEGRKYTRQALDMRKKLFGEINEDYITSLNNYAMSFSLEKNNAKAVEYQEQVMKLCDKLPKPHKNIGLYSLNMGKFYYLCNNINGAIKYWEKALPLAEKYSEMYEYLLQGLGAAYNDKEDIEGQKRIMALAEDHNQHELTKECNEPKCMIERAQYYAATGENAKAKEYFLKALDMKMDATTRVDALEQYASFLSMTMKDYASASDYYLQSARESQQAEGENKKSVHLLFSAAQTGFVGKKYQQSIAYYKEVTDYYQQHKDSTSLLNIAKCQLGMGDAYTGMQDYAHAAECFAQVVDYYKLNCKEDNNYPKAILKLAKAEKFNKDYEHSITHHKQAMEEFSNRGMEEEYANATSSLKLCYAYAGKKVDVKENTEIANKLQNEKLDRMIAEEEARLDMAHRFLGKHAYARSLGIIAGCHAIKKDYTDGAAYFGKYISAIRDAIRDEFRMQSEEERTITWNDEMIHIQSLKEMLVSLPADDAEQRASLAATAYDAELLSKGILLNSSIEFSKLIDSYHDKSLTTLYEKTIANQKEIEKLRTSVLSEADMQIILNKQQENDKLKLQLYQRCSEIADYTDYISYTWQDVKKKMLKTDVAIEFMKVDFGPFDQDNTMMALVITGDGNAPVAVPVCPLTEAERMAVIGDSIFSFTNNPVWGALDKYLSGKKRIFFSADGSFNSIGIEYLLYNGKPFSDQFDVYRLSTTKELCYRKQRNPYNKVAIFGDIDYNEDKKMTTAEVRSKLSTMRSTENGSQGLFENLEATRQEIDNISDLLKKKGIKNATVISGEEATEQVFKTLSDTHVHLIHIASHGVFDNKKGATDAQAMANSILAFAGANLGGEKNNDGIVTAADVATMNLRQCDLTVLSACESGLGNLSSDWVFGLQRGFNNAGVHSLLMSLKKVYDATTSMMMTSFYNYLLTGSTKHEALRKAQQELRSKGYDNVKYWAAFILLDDYDN